MSILEEKNGADPELLVYTVTLINKVCVGGRTKRQFWASRALDFWSPSALTLPSPLHLPDTGSAPRSIHRKLPGWPTCPNSTNSAPFPISGEETVLPDERNVFPQTRS